MTPRALRIRAKVQDILRELDESESPDEREECARELAALQPGVHEALTKPWARSGE